MRQLIVFGRISSQTSPLESVVATFSVSLLGIVPLLLVMSAIP